MSLDESLLHSLNHGMLVCIRCIHDCVLMLLLFLLFLLFFLPLLFLFFRLHSCVLILLPYHLLCFAVIHSRKQLIISILLPCECLILLGGQLLLCLAHVTIVLRTLVAQARFLYSQRKDPLISTLVISFKLFLLLPELCHLELPQLALLFESHLGLHAELLIVEQLLELMFLLIHC